MTSKSCLQRLVVRYVNWLPTTHLRMIMMNVMAGRTRACTRAEAQQGASVLFVTLGPFAGTEMVEALISEQRASDEGELPKELVQDVESEPASFQEPAALSML